MSKRGDTIETTTRAKSGHPPHPILRFLLYVFPSFFDLSPPCVFPLHLGMGSDLLCALLPSFILLVPADFPFIAAVNSSLASGSFHTHPPLSVLTFLYNLYVNRSIHAFATSVSSKMLLSYFVWKTLFTEYLIILLTKWKGYWE